jgi:hypothetical protein
MEYAHRHPHTSLLSSGYRSRCSIIDRVALCCWPLIRSFSVVALNPAFLALVQTSLDMLQVLILSVLVKQLLAQAQTDCNSPTGIIIMQDPQGYDVSLGRSMSIFVVTGSIIEPLVFPPISLQLRQAQNSSKMRPSMHAFCNGDVFVEPGVLLTSCFSKEMQPDADAFEEEICLRWLHPVGGFGAEERRSVAKVPSYCLYHQTIFQALKNVAAHGIWYIF